MERVVDPEFDDTPPVLPGECATGRCDGSGWVSVSEAYVEKWAGPPPSIPEGDTPEERKAFEEAHKWWRVVCAAFRRSSFPCPTCMPRQFERWSGGHWDRFHDRDGCADCRRVDSESGKKARSRRRTPEAPPAPPEPVYVPEPEPPTVYEQEAMV